MKENLKKITITSALFLIAVLFISFVVVSNSVSPNYYKAQLSGTSISPTESPVVSSTEPPACPTQTCPPGTQQFDDGSTKLDAKKPLPCCGQPGVVCGTAPNQSCRYSCSSVTPVSTCTKPTDILCGENYTLAHPAQNPVITKCCDVTKSSCYVHPYSSFGPLPFEVPQSYTADCCSRSSSGESLDCGTPPNQTCCKDGQHCTNGRCITNPCPDLTTSVCPTYDAFGKIISNICCTKDQACVSGKCVTKKTCCLGLYAENPDCSKFDASVFSSCASAHYQLTCEGLFYNGSKDPCRWDSINKKCISNTILCFVHNNDCTWDGVNQKCVGDLYSQCKVLSDANSKDCDVGPVVQSFDNSQIDTSKGKNLSIVGDIANTYKTENQCTDLKLTVVRHGMPTQCNLVNSTVNSCMCVGGNCNVVWFSCSVGAYGDEVQQLVDKIQKEICATNNPNTSVTVQLQQTDVCLVTQTPVTVEIACNRPPVFHYFDCKKLPSSCNSYLEQTLTCSNYSDSGVFKNNSTYKCCYRDKVTNEGIWILGSSCPNNEAFK